MIAKEETRTAMLIGEDAVEILRRSSVAVFGVGGVGSYICEAIARAGVGRIDLFDGDTVSLSNINRQLIALHSTVGMPKAEVMRARILDINPQCDVRAHNVFLKNDKTLDFLSCVFLVMFINNFLTRLFFL